MLVFSQSTKYNIGCLRSNSCWIPFTISSRFRHESLDQNFIIFNILRIHNHLECKQVDALAKVSNNTFICIFRVYHHQCISLEAEILFVTSNIVCIYTKVSLLATNQRVFDSEGVIAWSSTLHDVSRGSLNHRGFCSSSQSIQKICSCCIILYIYCTSSRFKHVFTISISSTG